MHSTTVQHSLDALIGHAQALVHAYRGIAPLVAMPSYNPPRTVVETRFSFLPSRPDSFVVEQQTAQDTPLTWDNGASRSAHHRLAVADAHNAWGRHHPLLTNQLTEAVHALVSTVCGATTAQEVQRHVEGAVVITIDAQGTQAMVCARPWTTSVYRIPRGDDTDRLTLPVEAPHLATLLRGARLMALSPHTGMPTATWKIRATLSGNGNKGKQKTIETHQDGHSPQEAMMAMALGGLNSLVVPMRVAELSLYQQIDIADHRRLVRSIAPSFA